jgi:hypothetical protein
MKKSALLLTFATLDTYKVELQNIREIHRPENTIFVLQSVEDLNQLYITYNTDYNFKMLGTIKINRNKSTQTLFTIDALNYLSVKELGYIDKTFKPDWEKYSNSLLLLRVDEFVSIPTKLKEIIRY